MGQQGETRRARPRGFTLIEVMLAAALSTVLLVTLWGLFHVYERLFDEGQVRTEQAQLVRSLFQQLSDDLHGAIEDSPGRESAADGTGSVRRFGLLGSAHSLRIDVLEVIPPDENPEPDADVSDSSVQRPLRQVPELRTILYTFQDPTPLINADNDTMGLGMDPLGMQPQTQIGLDNPDGENDPLRRRGLTRREIDFETPQPEPDGSLRSSSVGSSSVSAGLGDMTMAEVLDDSSRDAIRESYLNDPTITWVPEVVGAEFRYFDGNGWSSEWNSLERKSLPVAVEVTLHVQSGGPPTANSASRKTLDDEASFDLELAMDETDSLSNAGQERAGQTAQDAPATVHRLVINMPSAKRQSAVQRGPQPVTSFSGLTAAKPLAAPRLLSPPPIRRPSAGPSSTSARAADQWMRTGEP